MRLFDWAYAISEGQLADELPRRWNHVRGVADQARRIGVVAPPDSDLLVSAAILHDVGYAERLAQTGFHPLDGANYLQTLGAPRRLIDLVAHHSCAMVEARLRGLSDAMLPFVDEQGPLRDALWYCDLTTSPDGKPVQVQHRLAEIRQRYGPDHVVTRFLGEAEDHLVSAVLRTEDRLGNTS